jgi:RimJ/RimL family protein N-acetyltransferase
MRELDEFAGDVWRGTRVLLREAAPADIQVLEEWAADPARYEGEFNDFDIPPRAYRDEILAGRTITETRGMLIVERVDTPGPVGAVSWHAVSYGPNPQSVSWNIGVSLVPELRGKGLGTEAQRLLAEFLFATTPVHRVEASTDVANLPEQRALAKAGFLREGVARGAQYRAGEWHDMVVFARLRDDA